MASQMAPAVFDTTTVDFDIPSQDAAGASAVAAICSAPRAAIVKFQGFLALYREAREEGEHRALEDEQALPVVEVGEKVPVQERSRRRSTSPSRRRASPRRAS